jgi:hypothetical protein
MLGGLKFEAVQFFPCSPRISFDIQHWADFAKENEFNFESMEMQFRSAWPD